MEKFEYDNENDEYVIYINEIKFIANEDDEELYEFAKKIADVYEKRLSAIAEFMLSDEYFINSYPDITKEKLIASLNKPWIKVLADESGLVTYVNHTLDKEHIIEFEYDGLLETFYYLSIQG